MRVLTLIALLSIGMTASAAERFITTKGEAKIEVPPDFVAVDLSIFSIGPDLARLKVDVDNRTQLVLAAAAQLQIAAADIKSEGMSITREYQSDRNANETLRGYRVHRDLEIKLRALDKYEQLSQALADAKVDTVENVEVDVDDRTALKGKALVQAARNARTEAQAIASELGVTLGLPLEVSEDKLFTRFSILESTDAQYGEIVVTAQRRQSLQSTPITVLVFHPHAIEVNATVWARFEVLGKATP